jgi:hypothetical protein
MRKTKRPVLETLPVLLRREEAARELRCSLRQIDVLVAAKRLQKIKIGVRGSRITRESLLQLAADD